MVSDKQPFVGTGGLTVKFSGTKPRYTTGLQVVRDPGAGTVWAGCFMLVLGLYLTFYMRHRRLWIAREGEFLRIAAFSHRDAANLGRQLRVRIARLLPQEGELLSEDPTPPKGATPAENVEEE